MKADTKYTPKGKTTEEVGWCPGQLTCLCSQGCIKSQELTKGTSRLSEKKQYKGLQVSAEEDSGDVRM